VYAFFHWNNCAAAMPASRATSETDLPGNFLPLRT
jgi:hypothetical protein